MGLGAGVSKSICAAWHVAGKNVARGGCWAFGCSSPEAESRAGQQLAGGSTSVRWMPVSKLCFKLYGRSAKVADDARHGPQQTPAFLPRPFQRRPGDWPGSALTQLQPRRELRSIGGTAAAAVGQGNLKSQKARALKRGDRTPAGPGASWRFASTGRWAAATSSHSHGEHAGVRLGVTVTVRFASKSVPSRRAQLGR